MALTPVFDHLSPKLGRGAGGEGRIKHTQRTMTDQIQDNIEAEAIRIVEAAEGQGIVLRLLGGLAIRRHAPSAAHRALARSYPDIDLATLPRRSQAVETLLNSLGYQPNKTFNLLNGSSRLLFYDTARNRQIDVFVGSFEMCHRLPITERIALERITLPLAELLLTKLQIVQMNEKDLRDICALLIDHPVGANDAETINALRIAELCATDWGLWKTVSLSLDKVAAFCATADLDDPAQRTIPARIGELRQAIDAAPKSLKWKTRAALGERVKWYELPEEVKRG